MAPIIGILAKWGFSTIASAVIAKGKDVVQDLDAALGTEDGRLRLKQLEFEHEQFLITAAQADENRALEYFREEVKDKDSARDREVEMEKARAAPWWAPSTVTVLTFVVVLGGGWLFTSIDNTEARYAIVSMITMVLTYYYGTTRNSGQKDNVLADVIKRAQQ
jgi:hypothetical protein